MLGHDYKVITVLVEVLTLSFRDDQDRGPGLVMKVRYKMEGSSPPRTTWIPSTSYPEVFSRSPCLEPLI